jgi:ribonuclease HI
VIAATDGSAINNPNGPAGWAWFVSRDCWGAGAFPKASNQVAELFAILALLRAVPREHALHVRTDSQFAINVLTTWMKGWKAKGWRKADGKPPENLSLIKELDHALTGRTVTFEWVRGHAGDPMNEIADRICTAASAAMKNGKPVPTGPGWTGAVAVPDIPTVTPRASGSAKGQASTSRPASTSRSASAPRKVIHRKVGIGADRKKVTLDHAPGWDDDVRLPKPNVDRSAATKNVQWCPSCEGPINLMTGECRCSFTGG